jgi:hypothetical protein
MVSWPQPQRVAVDSVPELLSSGATKGSARRVGGWVSRRRVRRVGCRSGRRMSWSPGTGRAPGCAPPTQITRPHLSHSRGSVATRARCAGVLRSGRPEPLPPTDTPAPAREELSSPSVGRDRALDIIGPVAAQPLEVGDGSPPPNASPRLLSWHRQRPPAETRFELQGSIGQREPFLPLGLRQALPEPQELCGFLLLRGLILLLREDLRCRQPDRPGQQNPKPKPHQYAPHLPPDTASLQGSTLSIACPDDHRRADISSNAAGRLLPDPRCAGFSTTPWRLDGVLDWCPSSHPSGSLSTLAASSRRSHHPTG